METLDKISCIKKKALFSSDCYSITTNNTILPELIGDDYGCSIGFVKTNQHKDILYVKDKKEAILDSFIKQTIRDVPMGDSLGKMRQGQVDFIDNVVRNFSTNTYTRNLLNKNWHPLYTTLGKENHFIELAYGESNNSIWIIVHAGTRQIGEDIKNTFTALGKRESKKWLTKVINNWDKSLIPLESEYADDFNYWLAFANKFSYYNIDYIIKKLFLNLKNICFNSRSFLSVYSDNRFNIGTPIIKTHNTIEFSKNNKGVIHNKGVGEVIKGGVNLMYNGFGGKSLIVSTNEKSVLFPVFPKPKEDYKKQTTKEVISKLYKNNVDVSGVVDIKSLTDSFHENFITQNIPDGINISETLIPIAIIKY